MSIIRVLLVTEAILPLINASLFSNILRSLLSQRSFSRFVKEAPSELLSTLRDNEQAAGELVCDILAGNNFPEFVADVVDDLSEEAVEDLQALGNFVINIPQLAPAILASIEEDTEDVVSIIGKLVTDPEDAITVIVGGVESVVETAWHDITSIGGEIISDIACLFNDCAESTPAEVLALVTSCDQISAGAPFTTVGSTPVDTGVATSLEAVPTYVPPTAAATVTPTVAPTAAPTENFSASSNIVSNVPQPPVSTRSTTPGSTSPNIGSAGRGKVSVWTWSACALLGLILMSMTL